MHVPVTGPLIVDDIDLVVRAALDGVGIGYVLREYVAAPARRRTSGFGARRVVSAAFGFFPLSPERPSDDRLAPRLRRLSACRGAREGHSPR